MSKNEGPYHIIQAATIDGLLKEINRWAAEGWSLVSVTSGQFDWAGYVAFMVADEED